MHLKNRLAQEVEPLIDKRNLKEENIPEQEEREESEISDSEDISYEEPIVTEKNAQIELIENGKKNRNPRRVHQRTVFIFITTVLFFIVVLFLFAEYMLKG